MLSPSVPISGQSLRETTPSQTRVFFPASHRKVAIQKTRDRERRDGKLESANFDSAAGVPILLTKDRRSFAAKLR